MVGQSVDLRSDTTTLPTAAMRDAMVSAPVGDDVYGDDPTVNRLQEMAARKVGLEAAMFVPSGTMGNTCALLAHTTPGDEVLFESQAHMNLWECGNYATIAGLGARMLDTTHGVLSPDLVLAALRPSNVHYPATRLVCIENSHNNHAGSAWRPQEVAELASALRPQGIKLHMDGARVFNAAVAVGVDVREYTQHVDSVMFCVSKGLSAPVGSLLCGSRSFIDEAFRMRKRLGGAMRQAGVIAAAGIVALEQMVERLAEDHANAARLASGLAELPGFRTITPPIPTNIVNVDVADRGWSSEELIAHWQKLGIRCNPRPPSRVRLVTHRHVSAADVEYVIAASRQLLARV
jgi:threonine aldolase